MTNSPTKTSVTGGASKVALHQKTKPLAKPLAKTQMLGKSVDEQILQIVSGKLGEKVVRTKFIQMTLSIPGVVGACYAVSYTHLTLPTILRV